jgi:hypothetical protein
LKSTADIEFSSGTKVLLKARLLDLASLGIWILIAAMLVEINLPRIIKNAWLMTGLGLIGLPMLLKWIAIQLKSGESRLVKKLAFWGSIANIKGQEMAITFSIWAAVGACLFCAARSIGLPLGFSEIWMLITIQLPMQLLPLQGIANAGNHEGGWVAGLALLGISTSEGLQYALLSHALILIYVLALGPAAMLIKPSRGEEGD